jgi:hypothetical protein
LGAAGGAHRAPACSWMTSVPPGTSGRERELRAYSIVNGFARYHGFIFYTLLTTLIFVQRVQSVQISKYFILTQVFTSVDFHD